MSNELIQGIMSIVDENKQAFSDRDYKNIADYLMQMTRNHPNSRCIELTFLIPRIENTFGSLFGGEQNKGLLAMDTVKRIFVARQASDLYSSFGGGFNTDSIEGNTISLIDMNAIILDPNLLIGKKIYMKTDEHSRYNVDVYILHAKIL